MRGKNRDEAALPKGYCLTTIGEVVEERVSQDGPTRDSFIYLDIGSIDRESKTFFDLKTVPRNHAPSRARQVVQSADVLVSMTRPNLNAVAMVTDFSGEAIASTGFHILRSPWIEPKFLLYLVQTEDFIQTMSSVVQGALYPAVRPKDISSFQFELPPRGEQSRIVEKVEELLSDLDAGVAELKAAQRKLAQYRQSLLKAAMEGALTADWRATRHTTSPQPIPYQGVGATAADASCSAHDEAKMPTPARPYAPASAHLHAPASARMQSSLPRTASGNPAPLSPRGRGAGGDGANDGNTPSPALLRQRARDMRHEPTPQEHQLWQQLRAKRFASYKFRRQQPIGRYIVDFVCFAERLIVELDGGQHADAAAYDAQRDAWLQAQGFRVLRFWNNEWTEHTDAVLDAIWTALAFADTGAAAPPPLPNPSPARGEGLESETGAELLQRILRERRARWEQKQLAKFTEQGKAPPKDWQAKYPEPVVPDLTNLPPLPASWVWATLDQAVSEALIGLDRGQEYQSAFGCAGYIKMNNVSMTGDVDTRDIVRIDASAEEISRYAISARDLLLNTRNSKELVGKVGIVHSVSGATVYNNNLMRIRFDGAIGPEFACYQLCGPEFRQRMEKIKKATTSVAAVYAKDLFPLAIAIPPLDEQKEIVRHLDSVVEAIRQQETVIEFSLRQSAAQRKNILKAAFSGQLVPQDPNDEPASALLARIRAQREANAGTPARKRGRKAKGAA